MDLFKKVKAALRVTTDDEGINEEIKTLMNAGIRDLSTTGIKNESDTLFEVAVITYCKANFAFDNPEAERLLDSYESMKRKMMNTKEYISEGQE